MPSGISDNGRPILATIATRAPSLANVRSNFFANPIIFSAGKCGLACALLPLKLVAWPKQPMGNNTRQMKSFVMKFFI
jgi:hypothetical protein